MYFLGFALKSASSESAVFIRLRNSTYMLESRASFPSVPSPRSIRANRAATLALVESRLAEVRNRHAGGHGIPCGVRCARHRDRRRQRHGDVAEDAHRPDGGHRTSGNRVPVVDAKHHVEVAVAAELYVADVADAHAREKD